MSHTREGVENGHIVFKVFQFVQWSPHIGIKESAKRGGGGIGMHNGGCLDVYIARHQGERCGRSTKVNPCRLSTHKVWVEKMFIEGVPIGAV